MKRLRSEKPEHKLSHMQFCCNCNFAHCLWIESEYNPNKISCHYCGGEKITYGISSYNRYTNIGYNRNTTNYKTNYEKLAEGVFNRKVKNLELFDDKIMTYQEKEKFQNYLTVYWQAMESFRESFHKHIINNPKMPDKLKIEWTKNSLLNIGKLLDKAEKAVDNL